MLLRLSPQRSPFALHAEVFEEFVGLDTRSSTAQHGELPVHPVSNGMKYIHVVESTLANSPTNGNHTLFLPLALSLLEC